MVVAREKGAGWVINQSTKMYNCALSISARTLACSELHRARRRLLQLLQQRLELIVVGRPLARALLLPPATHDWVVCLNQAVRYGGIVSEMMSATCWLGFVLIQRSLQARHMHTMQKLAI